MDPLRFFCQEAAARHHQLHQLYPRSSSGQAARNGARTPATDAAGPGAARYLAPAGHLLGQLGDTLVVL